MLMSERKLCESEKRKYFQPITVIIGNSTEFWMGSWRKSEFLMAIELISRATFSRKVALR
jgi:hypothetical protein